MTTVEIPADIATAEPRFTLTEVVAFERPAWHLTSSGRLEYEYDGINFWAGAPGRAPSLEQRETMPREGWRHRPDCPCLPCRQARQRLANE